LDDDLFWQGIRNGQLLLATCAKCGRLQHPPSPMCPNCGSLDWQLAESCGRGTVLSWIVSHHPDQPDDQPRIVALVELEEGARIVSNVVELEPEAVRNDLAVELVFRDVDGLRLHQFRPASSEPAP
jgi:hypothetical protein